MNAVRFSQTMSSFTMNVTRGIEAHVAPLEHGIVRKRLVANVFTSSAFGLDKQHVEKKMPECPK
ncbi:hypothetical protein M2103_001953 [Ereboglobus sp. PH5-5]|uniref:hypothetical protein n=1 Tax=unclassified Ereboglobus TaxID=2626932 RepID=UPI002405ED7D|nr:MULTISPECIES: hypothetical protein [unclassified Ereboglobus]MDF9827242.1 hypothetical protein [Ereboglobus sp. PH5-10]MDF9833720.1 hypothetical protein [Ereboglobus sp. PH5-5]